MDDVMWEFYIKSLFVSSYCDINAYSVILALLWDYRIF